MRLLASLPNLLSSVRLALAPVVAARIAGGSYADALLWLLLAGITDGLDGWLARRFGWMTRAGALLDPLADKALLVLSYLAMGYGGVVPSWLVWLVVGRDAAILLFAVPMLLLGKRRYFPPSAWGKISTLVQILTGVSALGGRALRLEAPGGLLPFLFLLTAAVTAGSGIHYGWRAARWREPGPSGA